MMRKQVWVGISDMNGNVLAEESFVLSGPEEFFSSIKDIVDDLVKLSGVDPEKIYGLGAVTPGPVDKGHQMILNPPNFNAWHGIPLAKRLEECLGYEVLFENVSNASALAEMYFGPAKGVDSFMALLVDEGIGSGIVLERQLFGGVNELGHTSICHDGVLCECGNRGCLEKYAAIPMILEGTGIKSWKDAVDGEYSGILEKEASYLSTAITNANHLFDLDMVVLCGDLRYRPEGIMKMIADTVNHRGLYRKKLQFRAGQVSSKSLIASSVVIHDFFSR